MPATLDAAKRPVSVEIWRRLLGPENATFRPEVARAVLAFDFPPEDRDRMAELSARAADPRMSATEREELEAYVEINDILTILHARAGASLKRAGLAP